MEESVAIAMPEENALQQGLLTPESLHRAFGNDVWRFVSSKLDRREDAEDVTMEVFLAAFVDMRRLRNVDSPRLWLLAIARHKIAGKQRWWRRRREAPLEDSMAAQARGGAEDRTAMRHLLGLLPQVQQEALILKYVNGLTTEEVAKVIRRSTPATNSLLQRARETLREKGSAIFQED